MDLKIFAALLALTWGAPATAQMNAPDVPPVNSFFERGPVKEYALKTIYVGGEVADPGPVDLGSLPLRSAAVKELAYEKGKAAFKGAYYFTGYSLYDILNSKLVKKVNADFSPEVDLYVVVENAKGEKAVFSWGEIYYSMQNFRALLTKSARAVNPAKMKDSWLLPAEPLLACSGDLYNTRFISNPTKITVKSVEGTFPGEKHAGTFTPRFSVVYGATSTVVSDFWASAAKRSFQHVDYGHGMGYKGITSGEGIMLKEVLVKAGARPQTSGSELVVVSARDSYRSVFSLSEIVNRNDGVDFLVTDRGQGEEGRFALFSTADFFVDRNVRSVDKIEIKKI